MDKKFTPGPWKVHKPSREFRYMSTDKNGKHYGDTGTEILAELKNKDGSTGGYQVVIGGANCQPWERILTDPDARLIASAPDLYAALENVLVWMDDNPPAKPKKIDLDATFRVARFYREREAARAALAKVTQ